MSAWGDVGLVGKKPPKRVGGMAEALSIASDLGFSTPPFQHFFHVESCHDPGPKIFTVRARRQTRQSGTTSRYPKGTEDQTNSFTAEKGDDLIKVLRELTSVQRSIANLQVELQGRKDDKTIAHLTHVSEMEKKCQSLARITAILKDVIQNKDRIIARLQQPYSLDCIPVEAEYQKQFSELLMKAASDYGALTASIADFQWSQNFREAPSVWGEMLRPIPAALASCTRFFEAMSATRDSFATLQQLRVGSSSIQHSEFSTPPQWREGAADDRIL